MCAPTADEFVEARSKLVTASCPSPDAAAKTITSFADLDEMREMGLLTDGAAQRAWTPCPQGSHPCISLTTCMRAGEFADAKGQVVSEMAAAAAGEDEQAGLPLMSWEEVATHATKDDCWMVIHDEVRPRPAVCELL